MASSSSQCAIFDPNAKTKICCKRAFYSINDTNTNDDKICCREHLKYALHTYFPDNYHKVKVSRHIYSYYFKPYNGYVSHMNINPYLLEKKMIKKVELSNNKVNLY